MSSRYTTEQGLIHYVVDDEHHYPSVVSILNATEPDLGIGTLEQWYQRFLQQQKSGGVRAPSLRSYCARYLLTRKLMAPPTEEIASYLSSSLINLMDRLSIMPPVWVERSLDSPHTFVWDDELGYAGCPDWMGLYAHPKDGPVMTLVALQPSRSSYSRHPPMPGSNQYGNRLLKARKFEHACMQLVAYAHAMEGTIGIRPARLMVAVPQPGKFSHYFLTKNEVSKAWDEFRRRCDLFQQLGTSNRLTR